MLCFLPSYWPTLCSISSYWPRQCLHSSYWLILYSLIFHWLTLNSEIDVILVLHVNSEAVDTTEVVLLVFTSRCPRYSSTTLQSNQSDQLYSLSTWMSIEAAIKQALLEKMILIPGGRRVNVLVDMNIVGFVNVVPYHVFCCATYGVACYVMLEGYVIRSQCFQGKNCSHFVCCFGLESLLIFPLRGTARIKSSSTQVPLVRLTRKTCIC